MKRKYCKPEIEINSFSANEYVSTCYTYECNRLVNDSGNVRVCRQQWTDKSEYGIKKNGVSHYDIISLIDTDTCLGRTISESNYS